MATAHCPNCVFTRARRAESWARPTTGTRIAARMPSTAITVSSTGSAGDTDAHEPRRPFGRWFRETGWRHLIGIVMLVFSAFPLVYELSASHNPGGTLLTANSLFSNFDIGSYIALFQDPLRPYGAWFVNSIFIGLTTSFFTVVLCALAAYAFSRLRFSGRRFGLLTLLLVQMFPQLLFLNSQQSQIPAIQHLII